MRPGTGSLLPFALAATTLVGCWGRNIDYDGPTGDPGGDPGVTECGDDSTYEDGWRIEGVAIYQDSGEAAAEGLCIRAIDPTPALSGGEPELLASSTICADGAYVVAGITKNPAIGTFVVVDDCDESIEDTVMISATGISGAFVADLGPGDVLPDIVARVVTQGYRAAYLEDLQTAGYTGVSDETFQFLGGRVVTKDQPGEPLDGYTVRCGACENPPFYADTDPSDGLFGAGATANAATDADADAFFMVPMAAIGTYTCVDAGGADVVTSTYGSLPGYGVFIELRCEP